VTGSDLNDTFRDDILASLAGSFRDRDELASDPNTYDCRLARALHRAHPDPASYLADVRRHIAPNASS